MAEGGAADPPAMPSPTTSRPTRHCRTCVHTFPRPRLSALLCMSNSSWGTEVSSEAPEQGGVFISYRRDDAAAYAGRLYDRLSDRFGERRVFMDVDSISPGTDFFAAITEAVRACKVLLVLIGNRWLVEEEEEDSSRLDDTRDFVRIEIESALKHGLRVIPILVDGAKMPSPQELPTTIRPLSNLQAMEITHTRFRIDSQWVIDVVGKTVEPIEVDIPREVVQPTEPIAQTPVRARNWRSEVVQKSLTSVTLQVHLSFDTHIINVHWGMKDALKVDGNILASSAWNLNGTHRFLLSDGSRQLPAEIELKEGTFGGYSVKRLEINGITLYPE